VRGFICKNIKHDRKIILTFSVYKIQIKRLLIILDYCRTADMNKIIISKNFSMNSLNISDIFIHNYFSLLTLMLQLYIMDIEFRV